MTRLLSLGVLVCLAGCTTSSPESAPASPRSEVCSTATEAQIAALFDQWNQSLQTGDPGAVVAHYAEGAVLLPTLSNVPRITTSEKADYFTEFLKYQPSGSIDSRTIRIDCTTAVDAGLYTFTLKASNTTVKARYTFTYSWDGSRWLITSHHSSAMPEKM